MEDMVISGLLVGLLAPAVITDLRYRRIPNTLVLPFWGIALLTGLIVGGPTGLASSSAGLGSALLVSLLFWFPGWLGAGDVKLMAAAGALIGGSLVWPALGAVAISGLVLALGALVWRGLLGRALQRYWASAALSIGGRKAVYIEPDQTEQDVRLPYALAIALGTGSVWLIHIGMMPRLPG